MLYYILSGLLKGNHQVAIDRELWDQYEAGGVKWSSVMAMTDDVMMWKCFPPYWSFMRVIHWSHVLYLKSPLKIGYDK